MRRTDATVAGLAGAAAAGVDVLEPVARLLRDLSASPSGLSSREAARRLVAYGPNELTRRSGRPVSRELGRQFARPLALLRWAAAGLAWLAGIVPVAVAILIVIVLNAVFAFIQELQAERAVEALAVSADGRLLAGTVEVDASTLIGESAPVARSAEWADTAVPLLQARDLVFSGTTCTGGEAQALVVAVGMHTELGRKNGQRGRRTAPVPGG